MHYFLTVAPLSYCTSLQQMKIVYLIFAEHLIALHSAKNMCLSAGHSSFKRQYSSPRCIFQNAVSALYLSVRCIFITILPAAGINLCRGIQIKGTTNKQAICSSSKLPSWTLMLILIEQICKHKKHFYPAPYQQNLCRQNKFC